MELNVWKEKAVAEKGNKLFASVTIEEHWMSSVSEQLFMRNLWEMYFKPFKIFL